MNYDLLVIGNGFDLECKFNTSYVDFLNYISKNSISNHLITFFITAYRSGVVQNNEWNGFENILCQYLQFLDYLFTEKNNVKRSFGEQHYDGWGRPTYREFDLTILDISKLPANIYLILTLYNPLEDKLVISVDSNYSSSFTRIDDYENLRSLYFKIYIKGGMAESTTQNALKIVLTELEQRLQSLEKELNNYIKLATSSSPQISSVLSSITTQKAISFNYSKTAQNIYGLDSEDVAYVHGDIDTDIVVGVEQSMIEGQTFSEQSDYIMFFKRFRRIYKDCNKNYNAKIINQLNDDSIIGIYGHSLDLADSSILKPLFSKRIKKYDIYCYGAKNAYKIKLVNLLGLDLYDELEKDNKINLINIDNKTGANI